MTAQQLAFVEVEFWCRKCDRVFYLPLGASPSTPCISCGMWGWTTRVVTK